MSDKPNVRVIDGGTIAVTSRGNEILVSPDEVKNLMQQLGLALAEAMIRQKQERLQ